MAIVNGTSANDTLSGTAGDDTINGLGGNDLFLAGSTGGDDLIDGGTGFDSLEFRERATSAVVVDFVAGTISGGTSGTIRFANVERVVAGNFNDSLSGNGASQTLNGYGGADSLWGAGGADTLWGGAGADTFGFRETGTANADLINDFASGSDKVLLDASVMTALGAAGNFAAGDDRFVANSGGTAQDTEDRIVFNTTTKQVFYDADGTGSGAAVLIATLQSTATLAATDIVVEGDQPPPSGGQTINGTPGDDTLFSGADDDTINGFGGNDNIFMVDEPADASDNPGKDAINGGDGIDWVSFSHSDTGSTDAVIVDLAAGTYRTSDSASGTLTSIENVAGSLYDDELRGSSTTNMLVGGPGNDTIDGGLGVDSMIGGVGADVYVVDNVADAIVEEQLGGIDVVNSSASYTLPAWVENLSLTGIAALDGTGNDDSNVLIGNSAANALSGGAGADTLSGGGGNDVFLFAVAPGAGNADAITDFLSGSDKLVLDGSVHANSGPSGNFSAGDGRFVANATGTAQDASDRLAYNTGTGELWYDADGSGAGARQLIAMLQGTPALSATDIAVVNGTGGTTPFSAGIVSGYNYSADAEVNSLLNGQYKWGTGGTGTPGMLTYSFRSPVSVYSYSFEPGQSGWMAWTEVHKDAIRDALESWAEVANVQFTEVEDSASVAGDLRFGTTGELSGNAFAWAYYPWASAEAGDIWFGNEFMTQMMNVDSAAGSRAFQIVMHEIGHALGLKHPFESPFVLQAAKTDHAYTVMAYDLRFEGFGSFPETPMLLDVAAVQHIYGANTTTRGGDDVYSWADGDVVWETLWDGGGNDTIDWSGHSTSAIIDLNPGTWSEIGPLRGEAKPATKNLAIAYGVVLENANGGSGFDLLIGNPAGNVLAGGAGADQFDGRAGNDTLNGGTGADGFVFSQTPGAAHADRIADFVSGADRLMLDGAVMTAIGPDGDFSASDARFHAASGAAGGHDADDRVIYDTASGRLFYDADGNGSGAAQLVAILDGAPSVVASDITAGTTRTFNAGSGDDSILGTSGADVIRGFAGHDRLDGAAGSDSLDGGEGNDTLIGGRGVDTLTGGTGDDTYFVSVGVEAPDVIIDTGGLDIVMASESWTLAEGLENLQISREDTLTTVAVTGNTQDNVITRVGGADGSVVFDGAGGNDTLIGGAFGGDTFEFGAASGDYGNDWLDGGGGVDNVSFLARNTFGSSSARSAVIIDLAAGTLTGGGNGGSGGATLLNIENAYGGAFDDLLIAHDGHTVHSGGLLQTLGARLSGQGGDDTLIAGAQTDVLEGGDGSDRFVFRHAPTAFDIIVDFLPGTDEIRLDATAMPALGASGTFAAGDPRFYAAAGATFGHDTDDRVVYDTSRGWLYYDADGSGAGTSQRLVLLAPNLALDATDIAVDGSNSAGQVINGTSGNDSLVGAPGNDTINGLAGNDSLDGRSGNDSLDGGDGTDTMNGGDGDDVYVVMAGDVLVDSSGIDTVVSGVSWALSDGFENLTLSGTQAISANGNSAANVLVGNAAANSLTGAEGNDTLTGSGGADRFVFSVSPGAANADRLNDFTPGSDKIVLDGNAHANIGPSGMFAASDPRFWSATTGMAHDADDRVIYNTSSGELWYDADGNGSGAALLIATLQSGATLAATDIEIVNGSTTPPPGGQVINGTSGNDTLSGTAGSDTINGLGGNDLFLAGSTGGSDVIDGGTGHDTIEFRERATSPMVVQFTAGTSSAGSISGGSSGTISFTNVERIVGGDFNDSMSGNAASQTLTGKGGNDTLWGAGGVDTLWGLAGADTFVFREMGTANADRISDWTSGVDTLALDNAAMGALGAEDDFVAGDTRFASGAGFTSGRDASDRVVFDTSTGRLYYDADGSGSGAAQLIATVQSGVSVAATDIVVI